MDVLFALASSLQTYLPSWTYNALRESLIRAYGIYLFTSDIGNSIFTTQSVIPLLLSIVALYYSVRSLYRTAQLAVRLTWFILKWGSLVALIGYLSTGFLTTNSLRDLRQQGPFATVESYLDVLLGSQTSHQRTTSGSRKGSQRAYKPPSVFDSFASRQTSSERRRDDSDDESPIDQAIRQIQTAWQENGRQWWQSFGDLAGFSGTDGTETQPRRKVKGGRTRTR